MRFLHTSDLHLGKKLDGFTRTTEQAEVLDEIIEICVDKGVDAVIVAGDVYDTFIPSSEAENLFFKFIDGLTSIGVAVICVSGNHDDEDRLIASKTLAGRRGAFLCGKDNSFNLGKYGKISLSSVGENYIVIEKDGEECFIATLPYFGEAPKGYEIDREKDYNERVKEVIERVFSNKKQDQIGILVLHLFMLGGVSTDGERSIDLGGVKVVSPSSIPGDCKYTALGHLHKRQIASKSKNVIYSGSPLAYSYDEVGYVKSVTVFDAQNGGVNGIEEIALAKGKKLAKLSCDGIENADGILSKYPDAFIDFTIFSDRPLAVEETAGLKEKYPLITKLRLELKTSVDGNRISGRKHLTDEQLFTQFMKEKYGKEPDEELMSAYLEIISEE